MSIIKNEIPILEFDTEQTAVINPTHEKLDLKLPKKCVFAFLGEYITEYASKAEAVKKCRAEHSDPCTPQVSGQHDELFSFGVQS